jgi:hypothetical protein
VVEEALREVGAVERLVVDEDAEGEVDEVRVVGSNFTSCLKPLQCFEFFLSTLTMAL